MKMLVCPHRDTFAVLFAFTMRESSGDAAKETRRRRRGSGLIAALSNKEIKRRQYHKCVDVGCPQQSSPLPVKSLESGDTSRVSMGRLEIVVQFQTASRF